MMISLIVTEQGPLILMYQTRERESQTGISFLVIEEVRDDFTNFL